MLLALIIAWLATMVVGAVMSGWVLSVMWGWFVVPFGVPPIGIAWAIGISLVVGYMTYQSDAVVKTDDEDRVQTVVNLVALAVLRPLLALAIGAIVHAFM